MVGTGVFLPALVVDCVVFLPVIEILIPFVVFPTRSFVAFSCVFEFIFSSVIRAVVVIVTADIATVV